MIADRLKGSGRPCVPPSIDPMLALRTMVCADHWDEAWLQISARLVADARAHCRKPQVDRRAAQATASPPLPQMPPSITPKPIVAGRLTQAHPWNRRLRSHHPTSPARD